jgi:hypothetical protein
MLHNVRLPRMGYKWKYMLLPTAVSAAVDTTRLHSTATLDSCTVQHMSPTRRGSLRTSAISKCFAVRMAAAQYSLTLQQAGYTQYLAQKHILHCAAAALDTHLQSLDGTTIYALTHACQRQRQYSHELQPTAATCRTHIDFSM